MDRRDRSSAPGLNDVGLPLSSLVPIVLAGLLVPVQVTGAEGDGPARQSAADRLAVMKSEAARYTFRAGPGGKVDAILHPEPLLRWTNPVADENDAALFLWTRDGRPEAAA